MGYVQPHIQLFGTWVPKTSLTYFVMMLWIFNTTLPFCISIRLTRIYGELPIAHAASKLEILSGIALIDALN